MFIRSSETPPVLLSSIRLLGAGLILAPFGYKHLKKIWKVALIPAILLTTHSIFWSFGARSTNVANSTMIVNLVPLAMPFFSFFLLKEKLKRTHIIATFLAILAVLTLVSLDLKIDEKAFKGNLFCFIAMITLCAYLFSARYSKKHLVEKGTLKSYLVVVYILSGAICLLSWLIFNEKFVETIDMNTELLLLSGLIIIPSTIGHSLLNKSMCNMHAQTVSIANCFQFVFSGILGWIILQEPLGIRLIAPTILLTTALVFLVKGDKKSNLAKLKQP